MQPDDGGSLSLEVLAEHLWMLVPGLLVVYLGFDAGGYFAGNAGAAAAAIAVLAAVRYLTARKPFSGTGGAGIAAVAGIAALAVLSLVSQAWSHAPGRALVAFDLAALYLALTALYGGVHLPVRRLRTLVYGLLAGVAAVCIAGLLTRTLPNVFPIGSALIGDERLSHPVTYWNVLGMLAALGILLGVQVTSDGAAPAVARIVAAGLVPALAVTLLLTFSRGAIASLAVGLVVYLLLGWRLTLIPAAVATVPFVAVAVRAAYAAELLGTRNYATPAGARQGHHVITVLALCVAGACAARLLGVVVEAWSRRIHLPRARPRTRSASWAVVAVAAVVAAVALGPSGARLVSRQYHQFVNGSFSSGSAPTRARLTSAADDGRLALWRVAAHQFEATPLNGSGAATFVEVWDRRRPSPAAVQDAHSLYMQVLAELGVPGALALLVFLLGLLLASGRGWRRREARPLAALAVACLLAEAAHCAVDWDWQMPVVIVPVVSLAAAVGASAHRKRATRLPVRLAAGACCLALAVVPALVAVSQADLDASITAFKRDDCTTALQRARAAHGVLSVRPEPLEMIGYCEARQGRIRQAIQAEQAAIRRDPNDWEFRYALAIVTAAGGGDPSPALRAAQRLDPLEPLVADAVHAFRRARRRQRPRIALGLPLDVS